MIQWRRNFLIPSSLFIKLSGYNGNDYICEFPNSNFTEVIESNTVLTIILQAVESAGRFEGCIIYDKDPLKVEYWYRTNNSNWRIDQYLNALWLSL